MDTLTVDQAARHFPRIPKRMHCLARSGRWLARPAVSFAVALLGVVIAIGMPSPAAAALAEKPTLTVFAAASLTDAFHELGRELERTQPGLRVRFNFAGSQLLAAQIEQGAEADVFAAADERWMSYLAERNFLDGEPRTFAFNRLVVVVPRANPARIRKLQDLARRGVKLVLGAQSVPVGAYSREAIRRLSEQPDFPPDYGKNVLANLASEEENVKSVVSKVQLGEADAGFVYRSDVNAAVARYVRMFELPAAANVTASYPIGLLRGSRQPEAARALLALLDSEAGRAVLAKYHLMAARRARPPRSPSPP